MRMAQAAKDKVETAPLYVVFGKERRLVIDALEGLVEGLLGDADRQLALTEFEGGQGDLAEVLDTVRTAPFLSERRVVVLREAEGFISTYREGLEKYLERPSGTGVLVLVAETFAKSTRLYKKVAALGGLVGCETLDRRQLGGFLTDYAQRRHGVGIEPGAARLLVELVGDEAGMLCGEVDKLAVYVSDPARPARRIRVEDVEAAVGNYRVHSVFEVIEAMTAGRAGEALERFEQMLAGDREAQYKAVGAFAWHFRRLYNARRMLEEGAGPGAIVGRLGVYGAKEQFIGQVRRLGLAEIGRCLESLMEVDLASKRGGSVRGELELFIMKFCGRARVVR